MAKGDCNHFMDGRLRNNRGRGVRLHGKPADIWALIAALDETDSETGPSDPNWPPSISTVGAAFSATIKRPKKENDDESI